ncbi:MAG: hypothetical protein ACI9ES_000718, partial [Oceanospirillaceae bacterium]
ARGERREARGERREARGERREARGERLNSLFMKLYIDRLYRQFCKKNNTDTKNKEHTIFAR